MGKIDHHSFRDIIQSNCGHKRAEVTTGPDFGVDVSLVDLPNGLSMATTSDPLSLIPSLGLEESAWLSVHLLANDMATTGLPPMYAQFVLNLPANFPKEDFKTYWNYIHQFCKDIGTSITGGHTAFIEGQNSTIAGGGTFTSIAPQGEFLTSKLAEEGDAIIVTKKAALSSTSILALSFPETIKNNLGAEIQRDGAAEFFNTSSLKDALTAVGDKDQSITAMHDVTEGGILGAIYELAKSSEKGAEIHNDQLPVGEVQSTICELFSIDPRFSIGAGSMIITCHRTKADAVIKRLKDVNIPACQVGTIKPESEGIKIIEKETIKELPYYEVDPYWAAFTKAFQSGWK